MPEGDFVFSIDPLFTAIVFWDTVMSAGYFLTCAGFYMFARGYMRALLVFPLTSMLSALTQAAALLDEDGRVSPAEDRPADHTRDSLRAASGEGRGVVPRWWTRRATVAPDERGGGMHGVFHVGEAINRVLLLISHSAKTARQDLVPSVRRSRVSEGTAPAGESAKSASGPDLAEAVRASASDAAAAGGATDTDGEGEGEILPDASAVSGSSVSLLAAMEAQSRKSRPRRIRMRFPESVLNWVGSTGWHDCSLQPTELVPAVHLIFIKSRIPASVCERETFVTWAQAMLARHTKLAYHNPW